MPACARDMNHFNLSASPLLAAPALPATLVIKGLTVPKPKPPTVEPTVTDILSRRHTMQGLMLSVDGKATIAYAPGTRVSGLELANRIAMARKHIEHLEQAIRNCQALMLAPEDEL